MSDHDQTISGIGRGFVLLLLGTDESARAFITDITVRAVKINKNKRLVFSGPTIFSQKTRDHITEVILPLVDRILTDLKIPKDSYEITITNPEVVATSELVASVVGYSADTAIFSCMVSASLHIPLPANIISTGHIASQAGDIRLVKGFAAKIRMVSKDERFTTFIHPVIDQDSTLEYFTPEQKTNIKKTLILVKSELELIPAADVGDLVSLVFPIEEVVSSSLNTGFFSLPSGIKPNSLPLDKTTFFFTTDLEKHFWATLERFLLQGDSKKAKTLLKTYADYHGNGNIYPGNLGHRLLQLLYSLPPEIRRFKISYPVLTLKDCIRLSQYAKASDYGDVRLLFLAASPEKFRINPITEPVEQITQKLNSNSLIEEKLRFIRTETDIENLTNLTRPIDTARASHIMGSVTVDSNEEFNDTITAFYVHLKRHLSTIDPPVDLREYSKDCLALLERTFAQDGGRDNALAEAKCGVNGGLRFVLDKMTNQLKKEEQEKHVNYIFKTVLDPLEWEERVLLIQLILDSLRPRLPTSITSSPPEKFIKHLPIITKAYVQSINQMQSLFHSF